MTAAAAAGLAGAAVDGRGARIGARVDGARVGAAVGATAAARASAGAAEATVAHATRAVDVFGHAAHLAEAVVGADRLGVALAPHAGGAQGLCQRVVLGARRRPLLARRGTGLRRVAVVVVLADGADGRAEAVPPQVGDGAAEFAWR